MSDRPAALYALKALAEAQGLEAEAHGEAHPAVNMGQVFRVKLGFNPNSSSLGTSVVTLVWGVGVAGALFQLVGQWIRADQQAAAGSLPEEESGDAPNALAEQAV